MAKDTITVDGEDRVVREDTAKAYRAVNWTWISIAGFVIILAIVAAAFFLKAGSGGRISRQEPADDRQPLAPIPSARVRRLDCPRER